MNGKSGFFHTIRQLLQEQRSSSEKHLSRDLQSFLPPALEVLETPPNPLPRRLLWCIVVLVFLAVLWSALGKVDIITTAEGKIIPGGRVRVIQPLDRSMVQAIHVTEGQRIEAGQVLVELDQIQAQAEAERVENELHFVRRKIIRNDILEQYIRAFPEKRLQADFQIPEDHDLIHEDSELLYEEWLGQTADSEIILSQLDEKQAELKMCRALIRQYNATLPLAEDRAYSIKYLYERNVVNKLEFLVVEEERLRQLHTLEAEESREEQLLASITSMQKQLEAQKMKIAAQVSLQGDDLRRQRASLEQELIKLADIQEKQLLRSPVAGTVKNLAVYTVGGVVNEADVLMEIVPLGERLEVEAFIGNQDIGYVREGQTAEVKIHTFPFTKYGVIDGVVESVARDATMDEKKGLIYRVKLALDKSSLMVDGCETQLIPGMAVSAEIATGKRRLIEFFLSPLLRMRQESLRER